MLITLFEIPEFLKKSDMGILLLQESKSYKIGSKEWIECMSQTTDVKYFAETDEINDTSDFENLFNVCNFWGLYVDFLGKNIGCLSLFIYYSTNHDFEKYVCRKYIEYYGFKFNNILEYVDCELKEYFDIDVNASENFQKEYFITDEKIIDFLESISNPISTEIMNYQYTAEDPIDYNDITYEEVKEKYLYNDEIIYESILRTMTSDKNDDSEIIPFLKFVKVLNWFKMYYGHITNINKMNYDVYNDEYVKNKFEKIPMLSYNGEIVLNILLSFRFSPQSYSSHIHEYSFTNEQFDRYETIRIYVHVNFKQEYSFIVKNIYHLIAMSNCLKNNKKFETTSCHTTFELKSTNFTITTSSIHLKYKHELIGDIVDEFEKMIKCAKKEIKNSKYNFDEIKGSKLTFNERGILILED